MTAPTAPDQRPAHWFKPGQSGNPAGRPAGSRNKINEACLKDLYAAWQEKGRAAIDAMIAEEPGDFVKVVASLLPRDVHISARPFSDLTDDDLFDALGRIEAHLAGRNHPAGAGTAIEGEATRVLPALPEAAGVPRSGEGSPRAAADGGESGGEDDVGRG